MAAPKRLTDEDVAWIRRMCCPGVPGRSMRACAKAVGCSSQHVSDILKGKRRIKPPMGLSQETK
jgi:hypothetical protein